MVDPIDIRPKKKFLQFSKNEFNKSLVLETLEKNILAHWSTWGKFQQIWNNQAFNTFKDFDKYILLIYLIRDYFQQLSNKFEYLTYEEFYECEFFTIDKLNLIKIASDLNIPKETIRRKVNELQKDGTLRRDGKSIILQKELLSYQKPEKSLDAISKFLHKKSILLQGEKWFGNKIEENEIKMYIKKYYTIIWLRFLKLQIPFLTRHRKNFLDLETWVIWGNVALHHQKNLDILINNSLENIKIDYSNYYQKVVGVSINRGVNASSIADVSGIPRATVIRKLRWLVTQQAIKRNKKLEYVLQYKGNLNKKSEENFKINQGTVAEFLADFFDYYKNSNFRP